MREHDGARQAKDTGEPGKHRDDQGSASDTARYASPGLLALVFLSLMGCSPQKTIIEAGYSRCPGIEVATANPVEVLDADSQGR